VPTVRCGLGGRVPEPPLRFAAIAAGGSLGTLARYGVDRAVAPAPSGFAWPTLVVNVSGSFLLGIIVTLVVERWTTTRFARPFAAIGFCGGFTTFSTMMVEVAQRGQHGRVGAAAAYLLVSLVAGLAAVFVGIAVARGRVLPLPGDHSIPDPDDLGVLSSHPPPRAGHHPRGGDDPVSGDWRGRNGTPG
jgi:CrcB protein